MVIRLRKRTQPEFFMDILLLLPFLFAAASQLLGLPFGLEILCDAAAVFLLVLVSIQRREWPRANKLLLTWVCLFAIYTLVGYLIHFQSVFYYIWGLRNNFRFYIAFFAFMLFIKEDRVAAYWRLFDALFWINSLICLFQYYVLGYKGDHLGGLFGIEKGSNGYLNIFLVIICVRAVVYYLNRQENLWLCVAKCGMALYLAALSELKFFYVEFLMIVALALLISRFSWRKLAVIIGTAIGLPAAVMLLGVLFPNFANFFSLDFFLETALADRGYTSSGDLNRLNSIGRISELFLKSFPQQLFGLGLGNADVGGPAIFTTPFFGQYSYLHYSWLSLAFLFLETGYIGLTFFFGFFALLYVQAGKIAKTADAYRKSWCQIAMILAACCVVIAVYNNSLRVESGYMVYFVLALPFIAKSGAPETQ